MSTTAEKIAEALHNDGQIFETEDGTSIDEMLEQGAYMWRRNDDTITVFADGSMILYCTEYWDLIEVKTDGDGVNVWVDSACDIERPWARLDENDEPIGWQYRRS